MHYSKQQWNNGVKKIDVIWTLVNNFTMKIVKKKKQQLNYCIILTIKGLILAISLYLRIHIRQYYSNNSKDFIENNNT